MKINLFTSYFKHPNPIRQHEIDFCRDKNSKLNFDFINVYYGDDLPNYPFFFEKFKSFPNDINILTNSDIFLSNETLEQLREYFINLSEEERHKTCVCLSRWEYYDDNNILSPRAQDSQDSWIFYGEVNYDESINDVTLGTPGCDNRILAELIYRYGYKVINPSLTIKTYHFHVTGDETRTYLDSSYQRTRMVQGPYEFLPPHFLENKKTETLETSEILETESEVLQSSETLEVNVIITCYSKESYLPHLINILNSYKKIKVNYVISYNGIDDNFECDFRCEYQPNGGRGNDGHTSGCPYSEGDCELIIGGYELLKENGVKKWIKLSIDSWLLDEEKIIQIFDELNKTKSSYAGNYWYDDKNLSTDIFFINTEENDIFQVLKEHRTPYFDYIYETKCSYGLEFYMSIITQTFDRLIILDREPIEPSSTRWSVPNLGWVMFHNLDENIEFSKNYTPNNQKMEFEKIKGTKIPFILENYKPYI